MCIAKAEIEAFSAENPELLKLFSFKPGLGQTGVGQNIFCVLRLLPGIQPVLISTFSIHLTPFTPGTLKRAVVCVMNAYFKNHIVICNLIALLWMVKDVVLFFLSYRQMNWICYDRVNCLDLLFVLYCLFVC